MWKLRRVLTLLGVGAATAFAAFALPMSAAHAADDGIAPGWGGGPYETCAGAVCLVMGDENLDNWQYSGIRPYFTDWNGAQDYNVQYTSDDGSVTDAGTYNIKIEDIWSPFYASSDYEFGDFAPNADAPDSLDLGWFGDLSGATIHKLSFFDGAITNLMINNVGPHDVSYWVVSTPDYTNTLVTADGVSADFIQYGDSDPMFLWNSLFHSGLDEAQVPDYLVPADPFAGIDFDPSQYLADALIS
jgi:hypothetical protein